MNRMCLVVFVLILVVVAPAVVPAAQWTQVLSSVDGNIIDFEALSATQVWACTTSGYIYFYNGETMVVQTNLSQGVSIHLNGLSAVDSEHVWASGYLSSPPAAQVFLYDGTAWSEQLAATNNGVTQFNGIYAADTEHIWAVGNAAQIWYSGDGGSTWTAQYDHANNKTWRAIDGIDASNVWACGQDHSLGDAQIMYFDGTDWSYEYSENIGSPGFAAIDVMGTNNAWVIGGSNGFVLCRNSGTWNDFTPLGSNTYNWAGISRNKYGEMWAMFMGAGVFYLADDEWISVSNFNYSETFNMIYALDASPWYIWEYDFIKKLNMLDLRPAMDRMGFGVGLCWNSISGRQYQVEWTDDPATQSWKKAEAVIAMESVTYWADIGDGTTNRLPPDSSGSRSYRVVEPE